MGVKTTTTHGGYYHAISVPMTAVTVVFEKGMDAITFMIGMSCFELPASPEMQQAVYKDIMEGNN